jgi:hypothetical protein
MFATAYRSAGRRAGAAFGVLSLLFGLVVVAVATTSFAGGASAAASSAPAPIFPGYWEEASDGGVYQFNTTNFGSLRGIPLIRPVVGGAATTDGLGYWLVASDGGVFSFGDARFEGSTGGVRLVQPIVGMAADPVLPHAYWLVAADGGIFSFGGAPFWGSTGGIRLDRPIVGMAPTPTGRGYWLVASDGGVFSFGDARFHGSTGGIPLFRPVVGVAATNDGGGYWLVASDGGIFSFGDARFHGSTGGIPLVQPVVGMAATNDGGGYWLVASDGGIFNFGDAPFFGASGPSPAPIIGMMATPRGFPFQPGATGYDVSHFQCGQLPPPRSFGVVEVNGDISSQNNLNPCYQAEIAWASPNASSYIFMNGLPAPGSPSQSYTYGYDLATHWVNTSRSVGVNTSFWWLDVEVGSWNLSPAALPSNAYVIAGAVAGLRASGVVPGIYSTSFQWGEITGNLLNFPGIALWVPGATTLTNDPSSATTMCTGTVPDHVPFAGGVIVLVQYGYVNGPPRTIDPDYACT